jgi:hypothetical protein
MLFGFCFSSSSHTVFPKKKKNQQEKKKILSPEHRKGKKFAVWQPTPISTNIFWFFFSHLIPSLLFLSFIPVDPFFLFLVQFLFSTCSLNYDAG